MNRIRELIISNNLDIDDFIIQLAWSELSQLCQCASPLRDGIYYNYTIVKMN